MSVAVAVSVPSTTGPVLVKVQVPFSSTVAVPTVEPSIAFTTTLAPASPVPLTVKVPLVFCVTGSVIATIGDVLST